MSQSITEIMLALSKEERREMIAVWPDIVRDIVEMVKNLNIPDLAKWVEKVLQYNVSSGKQIRGFALIYAYKMLAPKNQLTEDNIRLARILAWCVEMLLSFLQIMDDLMDQSLFRRGKPCWYRHNDIGEAAITDGVLLESTIYYIIKKYFSGRECYVDLLEIFQDITFKTSIGESLDLYSSNFGKEPNLDLFTMDRYNVIAEGKTAYCTYVLPVTVAMRFAGIKDPEMFKQATSILLEIGRFFQIQDDYVSCFGDSATRGKDDTDIPEGKCTWFVVKALQLATPEQRKILEECYGVSDPEKIKRVKQLFTDLNLLDLYTKFEEEMHNEINIHIQQTSCGLPHNLFSNLLGQLYRRSS
ncbi:PREDICTED: farnesyl pyrophosphate synthase-like [Vollenhovia emeryi]|uniref:farnesyl pyrophosphate synthase-like n=1 Tax=Vollenhovia emeryi TaxID=411798 RepID=UPI0005F4364F|nr:PREDICTED: farnesyl pyrophosphate synthase-like [Vollenhovia emeryi]XP_011860505.1 PREDICTED: farnesyl pyrophosphate synthase-like [Vollenhovia emeryi]